MTQELIHTIFSRRSIRSYTAEPVSEEHIETLLQTAMAAPSASNLKPWLTSIQVRTATPSRRNSRHQGCPRSSAPNPLQEMSRPKVPANYLPQGPLAERRLRWNFE